MFCKKGVIFLVGLRIVDTSCPVLDEKFIRISQEIVFPHVILPEIRKNSLNLPGIQVFWCKK